jgi:hypothetical protein
MRSTAKRRAGRRGAAGLLAVLVLGGATVAACSDSSNATAQNGASAAGGTAVGGTPASGAAGAPLVPDGGGRTSAAGSSAGSAAAAPSEAPESASGSGAASAAGGAGDAQGGASGKGALPVDPPVALQGRQIVRSGSFTITVTVTKTTNAGADQQALRAKVSGLAVQARQTAAGVGGYVSASDGDGTTQSITMRVPVDTYESARNALGTLGEMTGSEKSEDVTGQLADMDGRIATMKAGVTRIRTLLTQATKIGDVIAIESELSGREADLEATLRKRAAVADQVALSTITLTIAGKIVSGPPAPKKALTIGYRAPHLSVPGPTGFVGGVVGALDVLTNVARGVATLAGAILPFVPFVLLVALLIGWGRRRFPGLLRTGRSAATVSGSTPVQQPGAAGGAAG